MKISNMKTNGDPRRNITEQITTRSKTDLRIKSNLPVIIRDIIIYAKINKSESMTETCTSGDLAAGRLQICGYLHSQQSCRDYSTITAAEAAIMASRSGYASSSGQERVAKLCGYNVSLMPKAKLKVFSSSEKMNLHAVHGSALSASMIMGHGEL
ncbi:hypothetical protein GB937_010806 [Aspergillus fischeri]|nr:hypothetical protein GB937_010806 [Aspergillus fischeri]